MTFDTGFDAPRRHPPAHRARATSSTAWTHTSFSAGCTRWSSGSDGDRRDAWRLPAPEVACCPVISDFLFDDPEAVLKELAFLNATHDVFIVLIDSAFAFELPRVSAGWIETVDVETGRARTVSRHSLRKMAETHTRLAGTTSTAWRRTSTSTSCRSDSIKRKPTSRSASSSPSDGCRRRITDLRLEP